MTDAEKNMLYQELMIANPEASIDDFMQVLKVSAVYRSDTVRKVNEMRLQREADELKRKINQE